MRGPATRHSTTNRKANVIASQKIWLGNVSVFERRKAALFCAGAAVPDVVVGVGHQHLT